MYRSKSHLISLLRKGVDLQQWITSYTQWPTGLALLLDSGYTPTRNCIVQACEVHCEESIKLLINTQKCYIGPRELKIACNHQSEMIMELVVIALVEHRKRLQTLAEAHLPEEVKSELGISHGTLMSVQAYKAYQLLVVSSVDVSNVKEETAWCVYDHVGANLKAADLLWNSGFRDVNELEYNQTSLMRLWWSPQTCSLEVLLQKANWLIDKGADLYSRYEGYPALHFLGRGVGTVLHSINDFEELNLQMHDLSQKSVDLMLTIFFDDNRDNCNCSCSLGGCSGLTALLGGYFSTNPDRDLEELVQRLSMVIARLARSLEPECQERFTSLIAPCVLRVITFRSLDISHTCTHEHWREMDEEEIEEIQDEMNPLIVELEDLLTEFHAKLKDLPWSFPDYLTRSWLVRMREFHASRREPSEEEIRQVLETGVVLHG